MSNGNTACRINDNFITHLMMKNIIFMFRTDYMQCYHNWWYEGLIMLIRNVHIRRYTQVYSVRFTKLCISCFGYYIFKQLQNLKRKLRFRFNYITGNSIWGSKYHRRSCFSCAHVKIVELREKEVLMKSQFLYFWCCQAYFS